jgi:hypothetical protein
MRYGQPELLEYPQQSEGFEDPADCLGRLFERERVEKPLRHRDFLRALQFSREGDLPAWPVSNRADNYLKLRYFIQFGFDKYPKKYPHQK